MSISFNDYQKEALEKMSEMAKEDPLLNAALGLCGESGECADLVKKNRFQGHDLDPEKMAEELGDVLWYVAEGALALGLPLEEIARRNLEKLHQRYQGKEFTVEESRHRRR